MATSGSYNYNLQRDAIITMAFQLINVYGFDDTVSSNDNAYAVKVLNAMTKMWEVEGVKLWKRRIGYLFTADATHTYYLGSVSGANHCTNTYVKTTISADEAASQTVLSLTSTTGMTAADNIGIELDDGTRQWTTIVSVDSSTQVTITTALTGAAASGNTVVTYTSKINRPLKVIRGTTLDLNTNTETQMAMISHDQYFNTPVKSTAGTPNNMYYDKILGNSLPYTGTLYVFPEPNDVDKIITFSYLDGIQDFDGATDDMDMPQEWLYPLVYNLACQLAVAYGKFEELQALRPEAQAFKQVLMDADSDDEPLRISVKRRH